MSYSITINMIASGTTPLDITKYVLSAKDNPKTLEANSSVTLNFKADGLYFTLVPIKTAAVTVNNATIESWTCKTPFTEATLVISNPTADVVINITGKVKVVPQLVTKPFLLQMAAPVDTRLILTKEEMRTVEDKYMPEVYFALCKDDGRFYLYSKNSSVVDEETGLFMLIENTISEIDGGEVVALGTNLATTEK